MWPKEDYQEHMFGYLDGLRIEFEQIIHDHFQRHDFKEFYANLDTTSDCLWQLIGASDADWEGYRYPLEASCDELLRAMHQLPTDTSDRVSFHPMGSLMFMGVRVIQLEPEVAESNAH